MKSAVHFGAGNIGRGFIGLLLHRAGYHVTFVDVNTAAVDAINSHGCYTVRLAAPQPAPVVVTNISAVNGDDSAAVAAAVATADLITTAVGPNVLRAIAPTLARGLWARPTSQPPGTVIACENLIGASTLLGRLVQEAAPAGFSLRALFANCAVDRIIPAQRADSADPLAVTVEPFFEWIIDASAFTTAQAPDLPGASFVQDLRPYIERKLFTVNTGHAAAAYLGHRAGCRYIHEAIARPEIHAVIAGALRESGSGLISRHGFDVSTHDLYIEKILARFANPLLPDEVTRVGRSPLRKLGPEERLIAPTRHAVAAGTPPDQLARVIAAALRFDFVGDPEAVELQAALRATGPTAVLTHYANLAPDGLLLRMILAHHERN